MLNRLVLLKRQIISIASLLVFALSMLKPSIPYAIYYANYEEIVTEKCINKDKPEMHCNGKCYLKAIKKRMEPQNQQQSKYPVPTKDNNSQKYDQKIVNFYPSYAKEIINQNPLNYKKYFVMSKYSMSIFRPPKQAS